MSVKIDLAVAKHIMGIQQEGLAFSTDIAAAWKVVEKLDEVYGYELVLEYFQEEKGWAATFRTSLEECMGSSIILPLSAPMAICIAALMCKEVEAIDILNEEK